MRLGKEDFNKLLNEPMLDWVDFEAAEEIIKNGGQWLDVRLPSEFENNHSVRRDKYPALLYPSENEHARCRSRVRVVLRYGPAKFGRRLHIE